MVGATQIIRDSNDDVTEEYGQKIRGHNLPEGSISLGVMEGHMLFLSFLDEVCATAGRRKAEGRPACPAASDEDRLPGAQR
uniref:Uncharacterized protein n=1 Tax=Timema cristinae TaxID=61476 RepID=A0A7R9CCQ3_TIMCR|nr:unnamed protein product [Timema cristinae]